jgi:hypothetical protein
MIIVDVQQGTQEWVAARLGIPTASRFSDIITPKTRKASASQGRYLCELVAERLTGFPANDASTDFMLRGSALEAEAVAAYEFDTQATTSKVGFVLDDSRSWGCSPDRLVGTDGLLEIKCLGVVNHVAAVLGMRDNDHDAQVQGQLWITGRKWADLFFFNPSIATHRIRVERDEKFIAALAENVAAFCRKLEEAHAMIVGDAGESRTDEAAVTDDTPAGMYESEGGDPRSASDRAEAIAQGTVDDMTHTLSALRAKTAGKRAFFAAQQVKGKTRIALVDDELLRAAGSIREGAAVPAWMDNLRKSIAGWPALCAAVVKVADELGVIL